MLERSRIKEIDDRIKGIYRQEWLKKDEYKRKVKYLQRIGIFF